MPPRHAFWTILVDDQPTAFRAHDPEELLATLNRLKEKYPSAVMKWFERGKLWESREAARHEGFGRGERRWEGPREERDVKGGARPDRPRDRTWRPGGEHRDPRQQYKDAKKAKWQRFKQKIRDRHDRRDRPSVLPPPQPDSHEFSPPHGDPLRQASGVSRQASGRGQGAGVRDQRERGQGKGPGAGDQASRDRWSAEPRPRDDRRGWQNREQSRGAWRNRPPRDRERRRDFPDRSFDDRPERAGPNERRGSQPDHGGDRHRPPKSHGKRKPWSSKQNRRGAAARDARGGKPWQSKPPPGGQPHRRRDEDPRKRKRRDED